jgi:hypothetical protein
MKTVSYRPINHGLTGVLAVTSGSTTLETQNLKPQPFCQGYPRRYTVEVSSDGVPAVTAHGKQLEGILLRVIVQGGRLDNRSHGSIRPSGALNYVAKEHAYRSTLIPYVCLGYDQIYHAMS